MAQRSDNGETTRFFPTVSTTPTTKLYKKRKKFYTHCLVAQTPPHVSIAITIVSHQHPKHKPIRAPILQKRARFGCKKKRRNAPRHSRYTTDRQQPPTYTIVSLLRARKREREPNTLCTGARCRARLSYKYYNARDGFLLAGATA